MNRIDGKIALITGGTQGLGAAIAELFAKAGAAGLIIVGRDAEKGQKVAQNIATEHSIPVKMVKADLGIMTDVRSVVTKADEHFGRLDILVNAAGLTQRGNLLNTTPELFDRMFAVNTRAPFFLMQDAVNLMMRKGNEGSIVNIGSVAAHAGQPFIATYSSSKCALSGLTRSSGYALMRNRVRVNQLNIGWMNSDNERALQAEESGNTDFIDQVAKTLPFGRLLEPLEVARAVLFLASEDSGMMTGSVIHFDQSVWGGYDGQAPSPAEPLQP